MEDRRKEGKGLRNGRKEVKVGRKERREGTKGSVRSEGCGGKK